MNIAILVPSLGGGGAERVAQRIGDYYVSRGDRVFYFLGDFGFKNDYVVQGEIVYTGIGPIDKSSQYGIVLTGMYILKWAWQIRRLKKKYRIDVSISFMEDFNYLNVLSQANDFVVVRVCTILSERPELFGLLYQKEWIRQVYSRADKVVVMSAFGLHEMRDIYGIPEGKIAVIPNPLPQGAMLKLNEKNQYGDRPWQYGDSSIVFMGRLDPVKQPDRLLRAFRLVAEKSQAAKLLFLGKGSLDRYLKGLSHKYGLRDRIVFVGFTHETEYYLRHARVFAMSSKVEGFPNAMIEAMAFGVPVVATDSPGGIHDILLDGGEYGIVTPPMPREKVIPSGSLTDEETAFGKAILSVLEDSGCYDAFHRKSLERAKSYENEKVMQLWDKILLNNSK